MATGQVAVEAVADAADIVSEEAGDVAEKLHGWTPKEGGLFLLGAAIGLSGGIAIGWGLASKRLRTKYQDLADEEIASMKGHYNAKAAAAEEREKKPLTEVVEELGYKAQPPGHVAYHEVGSEPEKTNVFDLPQPEPAELAEEVDVFQMERDPDVPYIIHKEEYNSTPEGYEQHTLTYFEGDDVLSNERDHIIEDQDEVIGLGNLSKFGIGSGDPNIVYIRNEKLKVDVEVVHSDGRFATEVHGFQPDELQHSSMRRRSPRRSDHDADG